MPGFSGIGSLQAGDVLLYHGTAFFSRAIQLLDGTEMSHASLCLGDDIGEALTGPGLVKRSIQESIAGCPWIAVMRRQPVPGPMTPVLEIAQTYLAQHNRYGYEQILLLAGICLTRKLDLDNPLLRRLALVAMGKAADFINDLTARGKEPMICSEFAFRTYDEAMPEKDDPYSLEILSQAGTPRRHFSWLRRRYGWVGSAARPESLVVHPDSLLGQLQGAGETVETLPKAGVLKSALPPIHEDLDALVEQYVNEAEGRKAARPLLGAATDVSTDELLGTARLLAGELAAAAKRKSGVETALYGAPPTVAKSTELTFDDILADFVTPGDLLKSPSLERVGTIEP